MSFFTWNPLSPPLDTIGLKPRQDNRAAQTSEQPNEDTSEVSSKKSPLPRSQEHLLTTTLNASDDLLD